MKAIKINTDKWNLLCEKLKEDYPPSYLLIRSKMRETLGFTVREHKSYEKVESNGFATTSFVRQLVEIHLDFYDDKKRTMFLLKYGDYIG